MRAIILENSFDGELPLMKPVTMLQKELEDRDILSHYTFDSLMKEYSNKKCDGKSHTKKDRSYRVKVKRFAFLSDEKPGLFYLDEDKLLILWGFFEKGKFENRITLCKIEDNRGKMVSSDVQSPVEKIFSENEAMKARSVFKSLSKIMSFDSLKSKMRGK